MASSKFLPHEVNHRKIRVAIIGAGISGLAVANGLLKDPDGRFDVQVFERDTIAFNSERGGYQLRISTNGLNALKTISDSELWSLIREVWAGDQAEAPTIVDPKTFAARLRLGDLKLYPKSQAIPRTGLRGALLQPLLVQGRVHFSHTFTRFELMPGEQCGVLLHFDGQASQEADILIASDGSGSQVNRQVGLNNKIKLEAMTLIQSRGTISRSVLDELPESLVESGSVMFLGGKDVAGFSSVYDAKKDLNTGDTESYTLFWSVGIPRARGDELIAKAGSNPQKIIPLLIDYFRNDLGYGKPLEVIMRSATEAVRTGLVTSSFKPKTDWRNGIDKNSRVILLGDAVHPMTPGRGMGANQALTDAGNLVELFHQATFEKDVPSDGELAALVRAFDAEMYPRAFKMVKASESVTSLDLTTVSGKMIIACGINQRTTEILRVMGVEEDVYAIAAPAEIAGRTAWYTSLGEEGKEVFSRDAWGGGQYAAEYAQHSPSRYCILPQIKLEPILKRRAVELNPHQIFYGHEVLTTEDHGDFAEVTVKNRSTGDVSRHRGTYVIVADGGRQFTTQLGVEWSGEGDLLTMISAHIRSPIRNFHPDNRNFITWFTNPAMGGSTLTGYLYQLGPWPEAMTSPEIEEWMFVCAQAADDPTKFDAETALARAKKTIGIPDLDMELISLTLGMNSGIQDANNLVWKLSMALKDSSRHYDSLLDTYYEERSEVGKRVGQTSLNNMRSHSGAAFFDKGHPEYAEKQRLMQLASQALDTEFKAPGMDATIEWFGATTFRVKANGLVIFLDTWLERPDVLSKVLAIDDVTEADYIFISHAHFDHLPGADKIAIKTGAHVVANGEAINVLRSAGVPEDQLIPVSGGERIPLFSLECRQAAARGEVDIAPGPPGAPAVPDAKLAAASVHVWPSLHCLMPGGSHADVPAIMDTGKEYVGGASQYACTLDITFGMKYGLLKIGDHIPRDAMDSGMRSFVDYVNGPARGCMSHFDGGQLMYNFLFGEGKTLLWNGHLGGYDGILKTVQPQPDVLIQAIAGRANLNGRPFDGSAAQFAVQVSKLLGEPKKVIWCLHDEAPIKPWTVDVSPATQAVERETGSKVTALHLGTSDILF
ncbi:Phenol 2-monooxygenase [Colletotrichum sp. SAR 10_75]|nr:Phenol 2-monooxygenase [Colletotrichum sp. SAR 10_75]